MSVRLGHAAIGDYEPVYVIAEIGLNHNGDLRIAKRLIEVAAEAGAQAVKFQKRTPDISTPEHMKLMPRETPWGTMSYLEYRHRVEFGLHEYAEIAEHAALHGLDWFASAWDEPSVEFLEQFEPPCYKAASASLTDHALLRAMKATGRPLIISTGMSTMEEIEAAVEVAGRDRLLIAHSTSSYPCPVEAINLNMIATLRRRYDDRPIGYSGHEVGLSPTWAAVAMGACFVERHLTLDRAMWGTDQAASVEVGGFMRLVQNIRDIERAFGDGVKRVHASELASRTKLRRVMTAAS